ncbi:MAG TPA: hypothetical protein DCW31_00455 [Lactobacillus sp.]|nr:hypothetical protein [Lactobacillus sp.]
MTNLDIFDRIVTIMHHDYAGFMDKKDWDRPNFFRQQITNVLDINQLSDVIEDYLADFRDHHCYLYSPKQTELRMPFLTQRYQNSLYVVTTYDNKIPVGAQIIAIDRQPIEDLAEQFKRRLDSSIEHQEWSSILRKAQQVTLSDGSVIPIKLQQRTSATPRHKYHALSNTTGLLTLDDFASTIPMNQLLKQHGADLSHLDNLIIDVRKNGGGSDNVYYPLLNWLFPVDTTLDALFEHLDPDVVQETNYTPTNLRNRRHIFEEFAVKDDASEQTFLDTILSNLKMHMGAGLAYFADDPDDETDITGHKKPEHVYVLCDRYCGSSGDNFIHIVSASPKVTIVGRNSAGIIDYANVAAEVFPDFEFWYPTTRTTAIDQGKGVDNIGYAPDIHIPWTPDMLMSDVDLNYVLTKLIQ